MKAGGAVLFTAGSNTDLAAGGICGACLGDWSPARFDGSCNCVTHDVGIHTLMVDFVAFAAPTVFR